MRPGRAILSVVASLVLVSVAQADSDIVLTPNKTGTPAAALIFIQGAQIPTEAYLPLVKDIMQRVPFPLWVGIPAFPLEIPEPLVLAAGIDRINKSLVTAGMPADTPVFFAGHSLGGAMIQNYVNTAKPTPRGQILMGAFLTHTYDNMQYPVPTLTMSGELDGLCRCTRVAENWFRYIGNRSLAYASTFPVVIVPGMTHMQFASGKPPTLVFERDLQPEISYAQAHAAAAQTTAAFIKLRMGVDAAAAQQLLVQNVSATGEFSLPIVRALQLEGNYQLRKPCYETKGALPCQSGSPWLNSTAQAALAGLPAAAVSNTDAFADVTLTQPQPAISNSCPSPAACTLRTSTVTQLRYNILIPLDTGFVPISAYEMASKLNSRQAMLAHDGNPAAPFLPNDGPNSNRCRDTNRFAWNYALKNAGAATAKRFASLGQPMVMVNDTKVSIGLLWPGDHLSMTTKKDAAGKAVLQVQSHYMSFAANATSNAGQHYCKLLSPARTIEWMYVDGLRYYDSLANSTKALRTLLAAPLL